MGLYWVYIGFILGLYWVYVGKYGFIWGLYWVYMGLGFIWVFIGLIPMPKKCMKGWTVRHFSLYEKMVHARSRFTSSRSKMIMVAAVISQVLEPSKHLLMGE